MTGSDSIASVLTSECSFKLKIKDAIPDDSKLTNSTYTCVMKDPSWISIAGESDGACYAEALVDYDTKEVTVRLTYSSMASSWASPYDDMLGIANGLKSVVQYKIEGNLDKDKVQMTTRFHCKTYDNCALEKLRKLFSNLTISPVRLKTFKDLIKMVNVPDSNAGPNLTCMKDNDVTQCSSTENRCSYDRSKNKPVAQGCITEDPNRLHNVEYRFNVLEEMSNGGIDNSAEAYKLSYHCLRDLCNDDHMITKIDELLIAFALALPTAVSNTDPTKPISQQVSNTRKSHDGFSVFHSCNRWISLVSLAILFFSN